MPDAGRSSRRAAVVGGGLAGIAAALELSDRGLEVDLFEREQRLGGKLDEITLDGVVIPKAADNFLARRPEVSDLAKRLGLDEQLNTPTARSPRIYRDGKLHTLPPNVLGIPATDDLSTTGLISPEGQARAALDHTLPDDRPGVDESVGAMVRRRLGDEVLEYLVDPLLGGINAGDTDRLSLEAGTPQLADLNRRANPSLLDAARDTLASRPSRTEPVFRSLHGGLCRLVDAAEAELRARPHVTIHLGTEPRPEHQADGWRVEGADVGRLVLATPSFASAELLRPIRPVLADLLDTIEYSSVAVTIVMLPKGTLDVDPAISGVLVPRRCGHHVTAISFASHKWPHLADDGRQILRISVGRRTDTRWIDLTDDELCDVVLTDTSEILGQHVPRGSFAVARWPRSLPQYDVGHAERIDEIDALAATVPGLTLVGAWRHGLGLPAVLESGMSV